MVVYLYERLSDGIHRYSAPSEREYYNVSVFTSRGYLLFQPDIVFRPSEPGLSVVECEAPAVRKVVETEVSVLEREQALKRTSKERKFVDVIGLGASSVDYVNLVPLSAGTAGAQSKLRISSHFISCGGQVATMLAACSSLGLRTRYLGPMGNDANARRVHEELARRNVDVSAVIVRDATNQFAIVLVDESTGERTVLWHRDVGMSLGDDEIDAAMLAARVLHVDDVDEGAAIRAARLAVERGILVTSDLDRVTDRTPELVANVSVPIFAEHVPPALTGETDPERALRKLRKHHAGLLCVTLGARGAVALDGDRIIHSPAFSVDAADTTGSGDIFRAGFVYGVLAGWPTEAVLRFANAAAAVGCTRLGAMAGIPSLAETERLLKRGHVLIPERLKAEG